MSWRTSHCIARGRRGHYLHLWRFKSFNKVWFNKRTFSLHTTLFSLSAHSPTCSRSRPARTTSIFKLKVGKRRTSLLRRTTTRHRQATTCIWRPSRRLRNSPSSPAGRHRSWSFDRRRWCFSLYATWWGLSRCYRSWLRRRCSWSRRSSTRRNSASSRWRR